MSVITIMEAVNKTATILLEVTTVVVILVIVKVDPIVLVSQFRGVAHYIISFFNRYQ